MVYVREKCTILSLGPELFVGRLATLICSGENLYEIHIVVTNLFSWSKIYRYADSAQLFWTCSSNFVL